jgi:hypothetical protein
MKPRHGHWFIITTTSPTDHHFLAGLANTRHQHKNILPFDPLSTLTSPLESIKKAVQD